KPSSESHIFKSKKNTEPVTIQDFQNQIDRLSNMVEKAALKENEKSNNNIKKTNTAPKEIISNRALADHTKRIERIEASLSIKYETLAARINRLERSIDNLSRKLDTYKKASPSIVKVKKPSIKTSKKKETKKAVSKKVSKKKVVSKKKESIFHTVKKGETLYGLSKKYGTSIKELEKINHLPKNANIYPGDNLLIK
ncbi:MAG: LysM peptidoglycan-binding domain-containing protein, partial [Desulfobacterales bacterium]|nr:LysM peptidoglycan-binding domain-containing protein [Desulfobacterales bacterium]